MKPKVEINICSEIGELEGVIIHTPGPEVENMTPQNAQRALYSDILNLSIASKEYSQLHGVLNKISKTFEVVDLLKKVLSFDKSKLELITSICRHENVLWLIDELQEIPGDVLAKQLIEGLLLQRNTLTNYLSHERFSLQPLYNFYFTRDASISILDKVLISRMANRVRDRESLIMEAIFNYSGEFSTSTINPLLYNSAPEATIEGGDVLIAREDILIIGNGTRTTTQGIDFVLGKLLSFKEKKQYHILVQELPDSPESFIHLDMVFTLLDVDKCMVFEPVILKPNR